MLSDENQYRVSSTWKLLNSPFVLFVLSAIVLTLIPYIYAKSQIIEKTKIENTQMVQKLDLEISARLNRYHALTFNAIAPYEIKRYFNILNTSMVFPDFKEHTLKSLLWQLENCAQINQKQNIAYAIAGTDRLYDKSMSLPRSCEDKELDSLKNQIFKDYLSKYFNIRNWLRYSIEQ